MIKDCTCSGKNYYTLPMMKFKLKTGKKGFINYQKKKIFEQPISEAFWKYFNKLLG